MIEVQNYNSYPYDNGNDNYKPYGSLNMVELRHDIGRATAHIACTRDIVLVVAGDKQSQLDLIYPGSPYVNDSTIPIVIGCPKAIDTGGVAVEVIVSDLNTHQIRCEAFPLKDDFRVWTEDFQPVKYSIIKTPKKPSQLLIKNRSCYAYYITVFPADSNREIIPLLVAEVMIHHEKLFPKEVIHLV